MPRRRRSNLKGRVRGRKWIAALAAIFTLIVSILAWIFPLHLVALRASMFPDFGPLWKRREARASRAFWLVG